MKRINSRAELVELTTELGLGGDWHEPDQENVTVTVKGSKFDNAGFWPDAPTHGRTERHVILKKNGKPVAAVNLATLFAWATGFDN